MKKWLSLFLVLALLLPASIGLALPNPNLGAINPAQSGTNYTLQLDANFLALANAFYGSTDPASYSPSQAFPGSWWADIGNNLIKQRNATNTAWVAKGTLGTDGTVQWYTSTPPTAFQLSNRNRIINGGFSVNQRSYVSGSALAAGVYGHDRWKAGASGATYTFTQSGSPLTTVTITAGSLQQIVEGLNIVGGTYTLSWTGTAQGRVNGGSYGSSPLAVANLTAGSNVTIEFNTGTLGSVQFEAGTVSTPFEIVDYGALLQRCQRYYETGSVYLLATGITGSPVMWVPFKVSKRASPTLTSAVSNSWSGTAAGTTHDTLGLTTEGFVMKNMSSSSIGATWTASAEL